MGILSKILGAGQDKLVNKYRKQVAVINSMEPEIKQMDEDAIAAELQRIKLLVRGGESMDDHINRVFALAREQVFRNTGKRAYDVQLIAALALNEGHIAEASTGEGKTLMSNFATIVNAIAGKQVHVVTVNEYLAKRDAELCRQSLCGCGVTVGYIFNQQPANSKKVAYAADIVYGTPSEFGFDYLRDNMVSNADDKVQKRHDFAIIDEIDSILIDEARTPLIISGAGSKDVEIYNQFARSVKNLREGVDFDMDEAKKTISATEVGLTKVENFLGIDDLYANTASQYPRYLKQALTAEYLYHRDKDYIVERGEVKIVDPNTGRVMEGRRWSEGLHQAIEAKEKVEIQQENETMATVTLQNFFRLYDKLSGMTGTAMTEDAEFRKTYDMGVVAVPTNKPVIRDDRVDLVYKSVNAKFNAIADKIKECNEAGQPVLVGTVSVENSEKLSRLLQKRGIKHSVLNAKNHELEAHIIAQAGRVGAVTIATNMAGRGTDIILGGNPEEMLKSYKFAVISRRQPDPETGEVDEYIPEAELEHAYEQIKATCERENELVLDAGGLMVIGSERHESRRIDNQLRGRAGRQGDPGVSQFYISLEDDLMRLFGQEKMAGIQSMMERTGVPDDMPIDAPMVSKAIERAQHQVESMHYESRKHTLEYDDVLNKQRLAIYAERDLLLSHNDISSKIDTIKRNVSDDLAYQYCDERIPCDDWEYEKLAAAYEYLTGEEGASSFIGYGKPGMDYIADVSDTLYDHITDSYQAKSDIIGENMMEQISKQVLLNNVDTAWREHLTYMDYLKSGITMRSFGQRDPLVEYKDEAYKAFEFTVDTMYQNALTQIMRLGIQQQQPVQTITMEPQRAHADLKAGVVAIPGKKRPPVGGEPLENRNPVAAASGLGEVRAESNAGLGEVEEINLNK